MDNIAHPMLVSTYDKEGTGSYRLSYFTPQEARKKGIKMFVVTFVAAVVSVVLPGVHFVSVPLGILASPLVGIYIYRKCKVAPKSMMADFACPNCQTKNQVSSPGITAYYLCQCVNCASDLRLTPQDVA